MWRALTSVLFPVWCLGCGRSGTPLCDACLPAVGPQTFVCDALVVRAAFAYDGPVRDAIVAMKRGERAYLDVLARATATLVAPGVVLVPVPTTRARAAERGFDQSRELARRIARLRGATALDLLRKRGAAQRGLGRIARLAAHGRFTVDPDIDAPGRAILLDDVLTTGATLRDAAAALRTAGTDVTGAVVVARTPPGRNPGEPR